MSTTSRRLLAVVLAAILGGLFAVIGWPLWLAVLAGALPGVVLW